VIVGVARHGKTVLYNTVDAQVTVITLTVYCVLLHTQYVKVIFSKNEEIIYFSNSETSY
jgi:hypothetical protein